MKIVFDSTVIIQNFNMTGPSFRLLEWLLLNSDSELFVPKIVLSEVQNKYRETSKQLLQKIDAPLKKLSRLLQRELAIPMSADQLEDFFKNYDAQLSNKISSLNAITPDHSDIPHEDLITRDLSRRKPFQKSGKGYRDALLWEVIARKIVERGTQTIFITANKNDFLDKSDNCLHSDLKQDLVAVGINNDGVQIYKNLESFIDQHVKTIIPAVEKAKIDLEQDNYHDFSIHDWFDENLSELCSVFDKKLKNIFLGINYDFETLGINWIEDPSNLAVDQVFELQKTFVIIECSLEAHFNVAFYVHNFLGDPDEFPFDISIEESDQYGSFIEADLKLPINVSLAFNIETRQVEEYEGEFIEIHGWCRFCGEPIISDAAETCPKCGRLTL